LHKDLRYWLAVFLDIASKLVRSLQFSVRGAGLSRDVLFARFNVGTKNPPRVFNLDLHISIIKDLERGALPLGLSVTNWSISGANRVFRKALWTPDPVKVINASTWQHLNQDMIKDFRRNYRAFLESFDGFIATYPPAFAQIYEGLGKPILAVAGTRYEWPLTLDREKWNGFDDYLRNSTESGELIMVANNLGDADYLKFHTGVTPRYVPSLCDYTGQTWDGILSEYLVIARSPELINEIRAVTNNLWVDSKSVLGKNYSWSDLAKGKALFVVPYNISTMTLFEVATMGVPVVVPSPILLNELRQKFPGVLSELSFMEMNSMDVSELGADNPNNFLSKNYLGWWIERADFYNTTLMPNVHVIDRLEELNEVGLIFDRHLTRGYQGVITERNRLVSSSRRDLLEDFIKAI
jgi:hypothetical protein